MSVRQYDIGTGVLEVEDGEEPPIDLVELDSRISSEYDAMKSGSVLPEPWLEMRVWDMWLWGVNPHEEIHQDVMLNKSHLLGLFLARYMATHYQVAGQQKMEKLLPAPLCLFPGLAQTWTLRQLRDTVQNLQVHWADARAYDQPHCEPFLDACMCRLGQLAFDGGSADVLNDQGSVEDDAEHGLRLTKTTIRRFVSALHILYRHLAIQKICVRIDAPDDAFFDCKFTFHNMQGACDEFQDISMHYALAPGHKILYVHDFPGMYHSISQVVYFHNADHVQAVHDRRPELASVGQLPVVDVVPVMRHLYPDIEQLYECDDLTEFASKNAYGFFLIARCVYLVTPELRFYYHPNVTMLLSQYLSEKHGKNEPN